MQDGKETEIQLEGGQGERESESQEIEIDTHNFDAHPEIEQQINDQLEKEKAEEPQTIVVDEQVFENVRTREIQLPESCGEREESEELEPEVNDQQMKEIEEQMEKDKITDVPSSMVIDGIEFTNIRVKDIVLDEPPVPDEEHQQVEAETKEAELAFQKEIQDEKERDDFTRSENEKFVEEMNRKRAEERKRDLEEFRATMSSQSFQVDEVAQEKEERAIIAEEIRAGEAKFHDQYESDLQRERDAEKRRDEAEEEKKKERALERERQLEEFRKAQQATYKPYDNNEDEKRKQRELERQKQLDAIRNANQVNEQAAIDAEEEKRRQRALERQQQLEAFRRSICA